MNIIAGIFTFVRHHKNGDAGQPMYAIPGGGRATESAIMAWAKINNLNAKKENAQ